MHSRTPRCLNTLCCVTRRLARLRWRNAFAVLGTWSQQSVVQSGLSKADKGRVLPKVCLPKHGW